MNEGKKNLVQQDNQKRTVTIPTPMSLYKMTELDVLSRYR